MKHEAVGGQGEVLARCVFQIPDLVAACKYANYLVKLTVNYTNMDGEQIECLVWSSGPVWFALNVWFEDQSSGMEMVSKWNVVCVKSLTLKACLCSTLHLKKRLDLYSMIHIYSMINL